MINGREFAERFYSENVQEEEERLYSTGNDELDELLEYAFCDGYEYAQREFAEEEEAEEPKKKHTGAKVAAGVGGTAVVGAGTLAGVAKLGENAIDKKGQDLKEEGKKLINSTKVETSNKSGKRYKVNNSYAKKSEYEKTMEEGKKLVDKGIPLTKEARREAAKGIKGMTNKAKEDFAAGANVIKQGAKKIIRRKVK